MYTIREVLNKKDQKKFMNFPINLYKGNPYYVPVLYSDEKQIFSKNYVYNSTCDCVFFIVVDKNDEVVGRIEGIIQKVANEKWEQKRVRFTRFDAIDNQEVANVLFDAVALWAKAIGIEEFVGPLGYSDLEREGLLIEGFDKLQTYEEQYNFDYYQKLIENYGFTKDVDWLEYKLRAPEAPDERIHRLSSIMLDRFGLKVIHPKSIKEFLNKYVYQFFEMIDITYNKLYGTVPITKEMMDPLIDSFKLIARPSDIGLIIDKNDKVFAFAIMFPNISKIVNKYKGKITLGFLIEFLNTKKNPEYLDLGLIGVHPEFEKKGISMGLIDTLMNIFKEKKNIKWMETNLMLEENKNILNTIAYFDKEFTKRRRCFIKKI